MAGLQNMNVSMAQIAHLYYEEDLSQQEIADQLGVSRSLVALYLKKAREQGIVRFTIIDPQDSFEDLAMALQEKTGLQRVTVVPSSHNSDALTRRSLASAVARYLENRLQDGDVVGFGWGRTMGEIGNLLAPSKPRKIDVVPLLGESASSFTGVYSQLNQMIMQIAHSFDGTPHFLLAPLVVGSRQLRDALYADDVVQQVASRWENLTYACMGIGSIPPSQGQIVYIGEENIAAFREAGSVGDICVRYFDPEGQYVHTDFHDRLIGIDIAQLRKARHVIAVAGGHDKTRAAAGVLRSQIINELFVDEELAREILNEL
jgi:deoxyribonucleoside regulator